MTQMLEDYKPGALVQLTVIFKESTLSSVGRMANFFLFFPALFIMSFVLRRVKGELKLADKTQRACFLILPHCKIKVGITRCDCSLNAQESPAAPVCMSALFFPGV